MIDISIIIVHHRTPALLKLCLDSIKRTTGDLSVETIVVDSMANREGRDLMRERYPEVHYLPFEDNLGYAKGVNRGAAAATGKYLLFLNPDIILTAGAVTVLRDYLATHSDVGIVGPRLLNFDGSRQPSYFRFYKLTTILLRRTGFGRLHHFKRSINAFLMADTNPEKIQAPDWLMGSALMTTRVAFDAIGGMDESFFLYFEDVDWCRRFWHNDYTVVYCPGATVYHYHARESQSGFGIFDIFFNRKTRWHLASAFRFFWKYRTLRVQRPNHA